MEFAPVMGKLFKYILPLLFVAFFWNCADKAVSSVSEETAVNPVLSEAAYKAEISAQELEFCLPRQVSVGNTQNIQSAPRRTGVSHRSSIEFTKSGKVFNAGIRYFIQKKTVIIHSSMLEPAFRLICLGKLII